MKRRVLFGIVAIIAVFSIVGCKDDDNNNQQTTTGFKLTVTNIPSGTNITAASLISATDPTSETPVAVALAGGGGTFTFHEPISVDNPMPDSTKPFRTNGSYVVILAKVDLTTLLPEKVWMRAGQTGPIPVSVSGDFSLDFVSDFVEQTL